MTGSSTALGDWTSSQKLQDGISWVCSLGCAGTAIQEEAGPSCSH
jgi:hypothetical protein